MRMQPGYGGARILGRERMARRALEAMPDLGYVTTFILFRHTPYMQAHAVGEIERTFPGEWRRIARACRLKGEEVEVHEDGTAPVPSARLLDILHRQEVVPYAQGRKDLDLVNDPLFVAWARFMERSLQHRALEGCGRAEALRCARLERRYELLGALVEDYFHPNL
jgi:hypothetical protein